MVFLIDGQLRGWEGSYVLIYGQDRGGMIFLIDEQLGGGIIYFNLWTTQGMDDIF